eukprot:7541735-Alexandrium_andersonii.AAC.1
MESPSSSSGPRPSGSSLFVGLLMLLKRGWNWRVANRQGVPAELLLAAEAEELEIAEAALLAERAADARRPRRPE